MKERPILFNAPMVRALLDGSKTQTRRVAKPVKHPDLGNLYDPGALVLEREPQHVIERACPYGQPGDRLWVRETCAAWESTDGEDFVHYFADGTYHAIEDTEQAADDWLVMNTYRGKRGATVPGIHMPRWASRILLEIVAVHVERLGAIGEADARAEGVTIEERHMNGYCAGEFLPPSIRAFRELWEGINGAGSWDANPWVWVVKFKRVRA